MSRWSREEPESIAHKSRLFHSARQQLDPAPQPQPLQNKTKLALLINNMSKKSNANNRRAKISNIQARKKH